MPYTKSGLVVAGITDVLATQHNSLLAELKAAAESMVLHDSDVAITYAGGPEANLPDTVTFADAEGSTVYDIDAVQTVTYDANGKPTQVVTVFSRLGVTMTEVFTYTDDNITGIARTLS
jgi:hypothetical protein